MIEVMEELERERKGGKEGFETRCSAGCSIEALRRFESP